MPPAVAALYEPLIARDLSAIRPAVEEFRRSASVDDLYLAVARFAVLAYAPSQHSKHAVWAALAAHDLRDESGERWEDLLIECASYAAASRQPWSDAPIMDPPDPGAGAADRAELQAAIDDRDRGRAERWLARTVDPRNDVMGVAAGHSSDAVIMTDAAFRLADILGDKGRYVTLRMAIWEMTSSTASPPPSDEDLETLMKQGSLESAHAVFVFAARSGAPVSAPAPPGREAPVYNLARDMATTLIAHAAVKRLAPLFPNAAFERFLEAVHHNLETAPSLEDWSFA